MYLCRLQQLTTLQCADGNLEQTKATPRLKESEALTATVTGKERGPWRAKKRLTWYQIEHLRTLRQLQPEEWTLGKLSRKFGISLGAVKRILRSKFEPSTDVRERQDRRAQQQTLERKMERRKQAERNEKSQSQE